MIREAAYGTSWEDSLPWGWYVRARVMCSDGIVRPTVRIAESATTFFSVPCAVRVKGKTVAGYMTVETANGSSIETNDDPAVVKFIVVQTGRNAHMLPRGAWRREESSK